MKKQFSKTKILLTLLIVLLNVICYGQKKPFRDLVIDLDQHRIDSILPIEDAFYLKFISVNNFNLTNFRLIRVRKRNSYLPFSGKEVLYYKDIPLINVTPILTADILPKPTKVTNTSSTKTAVTIETTVTIVSEYPTTPAPLNKYTATVFLPALTPNFYYYLIQIPAGQTLQTLNLFNEILSPTNTALGNTALDVNENMNRHITATFGLSYLSLENKSVVPYLGLRYNFLPVNKWVRQGMSEMTTSNPGNRIFDRLAIEVGLTLTSIEDTTLKIKDITGKFALLTGLGYRVSNYVYISAGPLWYKETDATDKTKTSIKSKFYASLSLDWDIVKTFNSFGKLLGIAL